MCVISLVYHTIHFILKTEIKRKQRNYENPQGKEVLQLRVNSQLTLVGAPPWPKLHFLH